MSIFGPWVRDCVRLINGDGCFGHYPKAGALEDQVSLDMSIYDVIRCRWNELRNAELQQGQQSVTGQYRNKR